MTQSLSIKDANEAVAQIAYRLSETISIYPITPSSPMAEHCDEWSSQRKPNLWGVVPEVTQMQSEGGVAGAVHGALLGGTLTTTFTASQGLLLMIPNMYKIAGELLPFCMHVTARSLATQGLSIFGDHSDVMACRQTGFAMLASNSVQEAHDMAAVCHAATLKCRVPFMHFFDGFRTSHEINTYEPLPEEVIKDLIDEKAISDFRKRGMSPDDPFIHGTAQNPDVYFQGREASNPFYHVLPEAVTEAMNKLGKATGRHYSLVDYAGDPEADRVVVVMGSGAETCEQTANWLNQNGEKVGVIKVRLYRPFPLDAFIDAIPASVKSIAVLDRTKEPGSLGEPLYQDVITALAQRPLRREITVVGGRYGLGSKEFDPAMAKAVFDNLKADAPKTGFTVGIIDDVTNTSLPVSEDFDLEAPDIFRAVFFGLGSDGTVGANKNSIKIIGEETDNYAQAYFVYDSKKSGAMTVSHLRFGPRAIQAPYLIKNARFVGCHQWQFMRQYDLLKYAAENAVFLLNSPYGPEKVWNHLPHEVQEAMIRKNVQLYTIDAYHVAKEAGMGGRTNTIMQTCFFAISGILPKDEAIAQIKKAIKKTYGKKGEAIVQKNYAAVDAAVANLYEIPLPATPTSEDVIPPTVAAEAPDFVKNITAIMMRGEGDRLPVSALPIDGCWPTDTARWEKRNIATEIPIWDPEICIQCGKCAMICPHATIRAKYYPEEAAADAPEEFRSTAFRSRNNPGNLFTIQVAPEDCTGCGLCVTICPAKDKANPRRKAINMEPHEDCVERERKNYDFFLDLPAPPRAELGLTVKDSQLREPLFEYSGACAGCGETPYIKLLTQLFGDRLLVANATGCSSIYGGNLPTTPYSKNADGRGPAWANSLFEDNAEFGYGIRLAADRKGDIARHYLQRCASELGDNLVREILHAPQQTEEQIFAQRDRVAVVKNRLKLVNTPESRVLLDLADFLVKKSVWCIGGDGWAYDIGFGGLDHVLASGRNVNILVLDTEVYSNTGGQSSKSTPLAAVAKFAAGGKATPKKDLGMIAMGYGNVFVASVAMGAKDSQVVQAMAEAESFDGPSLIIAYSHCIAHGYNLNFGPEQQKKAVASGHWPLYRYDPRRTLTGEPALKLDSPPPKIPLREYIENEVRYRMLMNSEPDRSAELIRQAQERVQEKAARYQLMASAGTANDEDAN
ncbi:pyruvate:ferredoxin (flavodoxin) oxidoreductase [Ruficoccus amylovorans]|uniref:Pyruvate:ferredoxin (Flavodoxin) oxidoreductase n=1 Tax=Ruficoccus amylovorans TaxID=1804625 RepID=A0A842HDZ7_9BACT|nr:pyruvate:ferredoxin (flavodoxin) oxidoreductase [Ruficoccus amylovorans]MBC2594785.1 pyruvate:ferredoxin (flavodoxin) oxidoreductase [Ruficoccus amylovorans]